MADVQYEVMQQWLVGIPGLQNSEEERQKARELWGTIKAKWKADGIERIAGFTSPANAGGFRHTIIWRLKNADQYAQMSQDLGEATALTKFVERWHLVFGWA